MTITSISTGDAYMAFIEHLRKAQEQAIALAYLYVDEDRLHAQGWLAVAENIDKQVQIVSALAAKGFH